MPVLALLLGACTSAPKPPPGPDAAAGAHAAGALCKLFTGAGRTCDQAGSHARSDELDVAAEVVLDRDETKLGIVSWEGAVTLASGGRSFATRASSTGGSRDESFERGMHEWAVVSGVAVVDALIGADERPALAAVDRTPAEQERTELGPFTVFRGWTLMRGDRVASPQLDHPKLLSALESELQGLDPATDHTVFVQVVHEQGETAYTARIDGAEHPGAGGKLPLYPWPTSGALLQARQLYVLVPSGS